MSLTTFPPELFGCVVANIESQHTLANLAQCSRHFSLCTTPYLYRHVKLHEEFTEEEKGNERLPNLASLLIRRPDIAMLVRHFTLHMVRAPRAMKPSEEDSRYFKRHLKPEVVTVNQAFNLKTVKVNKAFKPAVSASSLSKAEEHSWLRKLRDTHEYHPDVFLALLLPALLKVEKLVLDFKIKRGYGLNYLERMIESAAFRGRPFDVQPPFEVLTTFVYSHDITNIRSTRFVASLMKLPAIQIISESIGNTWFDNEDEDAYGCEDKAVIELAKSFSPLTSLDLAVCAMSTADLGHILRAPKALKTFSYKFCSPARLDFTNIRHALGPQKSFLECLGFDHGYDSRSGPMTSFISFKSLKVFKAAAVFFEMTENGTEIHRLINIFPPSLETLHVTRFRRHFEIFLEAVMHLLAQKSPQQIPSLTKIILEETRHQRYRRDRRRCRLKDLLWKGTKQGAIETLSNSAAAQGVSIDVIYSTER